MYMIVGLKLHTTDDLFLPATDDLFPLQVTETNQTLIEDEMQVRRLTAFFLREE